MEFLLALWVLSEDDAYDPDVMLSSISLWPFILFPEILPYGYEINNMNKNEIAKSQPK